MKAFWEGLADFITSFWQSAKNQGFAIMLLLALVIGLAGWVERLNLEIKSVNARSAEEVARLRDECRREVIALQVQIDSVRFDLQRCIEARARLEAQNQFFKIELKKIKKTVYE